MRTKIQENDIIEAARQGKGQFVSLFCERTLQAIGGELTAETMQQLSADQITLLAYGIVCREVMEGGFIQLIHNGYGPFIFLNPFAKAMRLWGAHEFSKLVYKGRKLFEKYGDELCGECSDEDFMALFEQYPQFDDLDDAFVEMEEEVTDTIAHYVDEHLEQFIIIEH